MKNIKIYDNGGKTFDRYTVIYLDLKTTRAGLYEARAMSANPYSPLGFCQMTTAAAGRHLGKKIQFSYLPSDCQKVVANDTVED